MRLEKNRELPGRNRKHLRFGQVESLLLAAAVILLAVLVAYPVLSLLIRAFLFDGELSLRNFAETFRAKENYAALYNSLFVSLVSTVFATFLGTVLAWTVSRTDIPMQKFIRTALVMPFLIPPFISAIAWTQLLGPAGYVNTIYMEIADTWDPLFVIYGKWAIILVMTLSGYPYVYLTAMGAFERMNPVLEEAGQISGAGTFRVMRDITIPIMAPSICAGAILVFVSRIENFGIPAVMGIPDNYYVLTTRIYRLVDQSFMIKNSLSLATAMSMLLIIVATAGLLLVKVYLRGKDYTVISGKDVHPKRISLGRWRPVLCGFCLVMIIVTVVFPLLAIVLTALTRAWGLLPTPDNWTLQNFRYVLFDLDMSKRAIRNSIFLAVAASTATMVLGAIIGYLVVKTRVKGRQVLDIVASMPYSIPGTVFALGMILAWNRKLFGSFSVYNTIWIILLAYLARYLAYGVRTVSSSLAQVDTSLEEAARISGAGWMQSFRDIVVPLIRPGLLAGWFMVFMPALRELTISVLLWSHGNETLGVAVYNLQDGGNVTASAALAVVMIAVLLLGNFVVKKVTRGQLGY